MKNYLNFETDIKNLEIEIEKLKDPYNQDALSEVDTNGTEPLIYLSDEVNTLREDEIKIIVSQVEALKNAPYKDSDYFKVPTVLKK